MIAVHSLNAPFTYETGKEINMPVYRRMLSAVFAAVTALCSASGAETYTLELDTDNPDPQESGSFETETSAPDYGAESRIYTAENAGDMTGAVSELPDRCYRRAMVTSEQDISDVLEGTDYEAVYYDGVYTVYFGSYADRNTGCQRLADAFGEENVMTDSVLTVSSQEGISFPLQDSHGHVFRETDPFSLKERAVSEGKKLVALIDTGVNGLADASVNVTDADSAYDDSGHGTRMASLIKEYGGDSVLILSVKAFDGNGRAALTNVYAAVKYAMEAGADIISISASADDSPNAAALKQLIAQAVSEGITVVASAGNGGTDAAGKIPVNIDGVTGVSSCDETASHITGNYGSPVDYLVPAGSSSEAAAVYTGTVASGRLAEAMGLWVFAPDAIGPEETPGTAAQGENSEFTVDCSMFFYGDVYYWAVPAGAEDVSGAVLIGGAQQELLSLKTDTANGYDVLNQQYTSKAFAEGHGYAAYIDTHQANTVTKWNGNVSIDDYRGSYHAEGRSFNSSRNMEISRKEIGGMEYLGYIFQQNTGRNCLSPDMPAAPEGTWTAGNSKKFTLGENGATYWDRVSGVNPSLWSGWANTSSGTVYGNFRLDFYYRADASDYTVRHWTLKDGGDASLLDEANYTLRDTLSNQKASPGTAVSGLMETVIEKKTYTGYTYSTYASNSTDIRADGSTVIDLYYIPSLTQIGVEKVWADDTAEDRPQSVTVHLTGSDGTVRTLVLTAGEQWKGMFTGLRTHTESGEEITWQIHEDAVQGYLSDHPESAKLTVAAGETGRITNTKIPDFPIEKHVTDAEGNDIDGMYVSDGSLLYYRIRFRNPFGSEKMFHIEDSLPENTEFVSAEDGGILQDGTVVFDRIAVPAGQWGEAVFAVRAAGEGKTIANRASGYIWNGDESAPLTEKKQTETVYNYTPMITKTVLDRHGSDINGRSVRAGQVLTYALRVKNIAPAAKEFTVTDAVPLGTAFIDASDGGTVSSGTAAWTVMLDAGEEKILTMHVRVSDGASVIRNTAHVSADLAEAGSNEVVSWRALIRISKHIGNYFSEYGKPSFVFAITDTKGNTWYRMIEIENGSDGTALFEVPSGIVSDVYTVREIRNARYVFYDLTSQSANVRIEGCAAMAAMDIDHRDSEVTFFDRIEKWNKVSHADSVKNVIE